MRRRRISEQPPPHRDEISARAEAEAGRVSREIWSAAAEHVRSQPRAADTAFARRASWTTGAEASSLAQIRMGEELGFAYKVWVSRGDQRVRPLHRQLHGNAEKLDEPFRRWPGHVLEYPGDTRAPIDAWINCRCFMFLSSTKAEIEQAMKPADLDRAFALAASLEATWS